MSNKKLSEFLAEVSNWRWDVFVRAEKDGQYSSNEAIIFALIRACAMQKLPAIKVAINRLDGKLKTPIKIEYPKIFYLFPNAGLNPGEPTAADVLEKPVTLDEEVVSEQALQILEGEIINPPAIINDEAEELNKELTTMGLREALTEMGDYPRDLPAQILDLAEQTHQWVQRNALQPDEIPMVKSVVAASLLTMAQNRNIDAMAEVFDQIDGKLVETIQILGEDIYITSFASTAPPDAIPNKDGILQIEAIDTQNLWAQKLGSKD